MIKLIRLIIIVTFSFLLFHSPVFADYKVKMVTSRYSGSGVKWAKVYDGKIWRTVENGMILKNDAVIRALDNLVTVISSDGRLITVGENQEVRLSEVKADGLLIKLTVLKSKFSKDTYSGSSPTAVAGVRGDNVYEQNKSALKRDLYWEQ